MASAGTLERGRGEALGHLWESQLSTNAPYGEFTVFIASLGDVGIKSRRFFFFLSVLGLSLMSLQMLGAIWR